MKILHLADLHIGKRVKELSLIEDQRYILEEIFTIADREKVFAVIIAGDVYDKSVPSAEAVTLFDEFLTRLSEAGKKVFVISGNHDSAERIAFASSLVEPSGVYFSRTFSGGIRGVPLSDGEVKANVFLLPFLKPASVRSVYGVEAQTYTDAMREIISRTEIDKEDINILVTHQFVTGAVESGSEEMSVGGINNVDITVFDPFDYVALGHIHKRQSMRGGRVHYPGTPLKYSLSEAGEGRSVTIVDVKSKEDITLKTIPLEPLRDMREIRADFADAMRGDSDDYVAITLTDEEEIPYAVRELQKKYPNLLALKYDNRRTRQDGAILPDGENYSPAEMFKKLYLKQNNAEMSDEQSGYIQKLIGEIWDADE